MQLYNDYDKNKSSNLILKTIDSVMTKYVFYFIVVLKQMQLGALGSIYKGINISVESRVPNDSFT